MVRFFFSYSVNSISGLDRVLAAEQLFPRLVHLDVSAAWCEEGDEQVPVEGKNTRPDIQRKHHKLG